MGLPLHMTFCMPWSPTIEFSHPLVQVRSSNAKKGLTNYLSFGFAEMITWQGCVPFLFHPASLSFSVEIRS